MSSSPGYDTSPHQVHSRSNSAFHKEWKIGNEEIIEHTETATGFAPNTPVLTRTVYVVHEPDHITSFPNRWSRIRFKFKDAFAEFLGTMILIIFGTGVNLQVVLSTSAKVTSAPKGEYLSTSFGWGIGMAIGVWVSGGYSGGHINPAVTLSLALFRDFPWKKVPIYIISQVAGAFTGALLTYAIYYHAIDAFEGKGVRTVPGTAALFATYAQDYETSVSCFFDEFLATAILLIGILALTDRKNAPPQGLVPLGLFILVIGEGACLGMNTGFAINPARDLGPRLMTWIFYGREVWNYRHQYWLWTPILGTTFGAFAGSLVYDVFLFTGSESIMNKPNKQARAHHEHAQRSARDKIPAGLDAV